MLDDGGGPTFLPRRVLVFWPRRTHFCPGGYWFFGPGGPTFAPAGIGAHKYLIIPSICQKAGYSEAFQRPSTHLEPKCKKNWVLEYKKRLQYPPTQHF